MSDLRRQLERNRAEHRRIMEKINAAIEKDIADGVGMTEISRRYGVSRQHVYHLRQAQKGR
jgi:DNA-binding phage protein